VYWSVPGPTLFSSAGPSCIGFFPYPHVPSAAWRVQVLLLVIVAVLIFVIVGYSPAAAISVITMSAVIAEEISSRVPEMARPRPVVYL
jgi:hypothetical protein